MFPRMIYYAKDINGTYEIYPLVQEKTSWRLQYRAKGARLLIFC